MADGVKVTVRGKDRLFRKLKMLAPEAEKELTIANGESAREMVSNAQNFVPVRTGALRDSIVATPPGALPPIYSQGGDRDSAKTAWLVTAGNSKVRYGHLVEFGTQPHVNAGEMPGTQNPGAPAQPFFYPAHRLIRRRHKSKAGRALSRSIKKVKDKA
jgi:hypothetical protein